MINEAVEKKLSPSGRVTSCPANENSGPSVAGAGAAVILKHLQTIDRLSRLELNRMSNNGASDLQKQAMALALTDIGNAIDNFMVVIYGE